MLAPGTALAQVAIGSGWAFKSTFRRLMTFGVFIAAINTSLVVQFVYAAGTAEAQVLQIVTFCRTLCSLARGGICG